MLIFSYFMMKILGKCNGLHEAEFVVSCSVSQYISRLSWNRKVHYRLHEAITVTNNEHGIDEIERKFHHFIIYRQC
jgi:hypothetical protein